MLRGHLVVVVGLLVAALVALPDDAAAATGGGLVGTLAADACKAKKSRIGKRAFRKRYGKRAISACAKRTRPRARAAVATATEECQLELGEYGAEEFYWEWESFDACVADYAAWLMEGGSFEEDEEESEDEDWFDEEL